jgi:hypothetical protein
MNLAQLLMSEAGNEAALRTELPEACPRSWASPAGSQSSGNGTHTQLRVGRNGTLPTPRCKILLLATLAELPDKAELTELLELLLQQRRYNWATEAGRLPWPPWD